MSEEQVVTYELEGEVALIGLNRPDKRNAMSPELRAQLHAAVLRAADEAKCAILFGHGANFCAGLDLARARQTWTEAGASRRLPFRYNRESEFEAIARGQIPVIAALHGATLGGGFEMAAAAHIRIADETTFFALPEGQRGIFVGGGGSIRIARLIGFARMQDMMLTGRVLSPAEAERFGAVQYVVPAGAALTKARELAATICTNAPLTNFAVTNSLPRLQDMSYDDGIYFERMVSEYTRSPESLDRIGNRFSTRAHRAYAGPSERARSPGSCAPAASPVGCDRRNVGTPRHDRASDLEVAAARASFKAGDIHLIGRSTDADLDGRPVLKSPEELPEGVDLAVFRVARSGGARNRRSSRA